MDCPTVKENYNKFQDDDGCPDRISDNKLISDSDADGYSDFLDLLSKPTRNFQWNR